jgi:hypothetical protein
LEWLKANLEASEVDFENYFDNQHFLPLLFLGVLIVGVFGYDSQIDEERGTHWIFPFSYLEISSSIMRSRKIPRLMDILPFKNASRLLSVDIVTFVSLPPPWIKALSLAFPIQKLMPT